MVLPAGSIAALLTGPSTGLASANQNHLCRSITEVQDSFKNEANSIFLFFRGGVVLHGEACDASDTQPTLRWGKEIQIQTSGAGKALIVEILRLHIWEVRVGTAADGDQSACKALPAILCWSGFRRATLSWAWGVLQ